MWGGTIKGLPPAHTPRPVPGRQIPTHFHTLAPPFTLHTYTHMHRYVRGLGLHPSPISPTYMKPPHPYTHTHTHTYAHTHTHTCTSTCTCTHIYKHMHKHMHKRIHIHMHRSCCLLLDKRLYVD